MFLTSGTHLLQSEQIRVFVHVGKRVQAEDLVPTSTYARR